VSDLVPCFLPRVAARSAPEDSLTEAVAHVLEFADGLRKRFQSYLWPDGDGGTQSEFQTQRGGEAGGRVDIRWILGRRRAILECKLSAAFTANQPTAYLAELSKRAEGVFVLIAPSTRLRELCNEAVIRLRSTPAFETTVWDERDPRTNGYFGRAADVRLVALPWVTLSRWFREEAAPCEGRLRHQLEETAAVMDTHDHSFGPPPDLSRQPSIAREIRDLQYLVRHAQAVVAGIPGVETGSPRGGDDEGLCYGFVITLQRTLTTGDPLKFWFGLWFLAENTDSCMFLGGHGPSREWLARKERGKPLRSGYWVVAFDLAGDWADIIKRLDAWLRDLFTPVAVG